MRVFLRANPLNDQRFSLLIPDVDLPGVAIKGHSRPVFHVADFEALAAHTKKAKAKSASHTLLAGAVVASIQDQNLAVIRFAPSSCRVTYHEALANHLDSQSMMFGLTFTFKQRSHAAMFKLAWAGGQGGLIDYKAGK